MILNFDVQVAIMTFISERCDLLSFMQASRALYDAGVPRLLQFPTSITHHHIQSFCDYMLSGTSTRAQALTRVSFPSSWIRYRNAAQATTMLRLVRVLRQATFMKELEIAECEELLRAHPSVAPAIISMKSLETLTISNIGGLTRDMLRDLQSPITKLDMSFFSTLTPPSHLEVSRANPIHSIENLAQTLQHVTFYRVHLDNRTTRFPHVKTLVMVLSHGINAGCMTYAFPNLERLSFESWPSTQKISDRVASSNHEMNKQTQRGYEWTVLKHLDGNLLDLFFLGLTCRIEEIVITAVTSDRLFMLHKVLNDSLPQRLEVTLSANSFNLEELPSLIPPASRGKLRHLGITIVLSYSTVTPEEVWAAAYKLMPFLSITSVRFDIQWKEVWLKNFRNGPSRGSAMEKALEQVTPESVAWGLLAVNPLLRRINLAISGQSETFWEVNSEGKLLQYLNNRGWDLGDQENSP